MGKYFELLKPYLDKSVAIDMALSLLSFDLSTNAPKKAAVHTTKAMSLLAKESYEAIINPKVKELIEECLKEELTDIEKATVLEVTKIYDKLNKIPSDLYQANSELENQAQIIWEEAREKADFTLFSPYLKQIIDNQKKFIAYRESDELKGYDVLLNDYEPGFTTEILDRFFDSLKSEIVPLIKKTKDYNNLIDSSFLKKDYPIESQKEFSKWLAEYIGFDLSRGVISESAHPYTTSLHKYDVRFTTHYHKNKLDSSIYSTIHEAGHGKYEQGISDELIGTIIGQGTSMGMHESQSRFFENCIGRNRCFLEPVLVKLKSVFSDQLRDVNVIDLYRAVNCFTAGLIRIEADELTYGLHIMIRYEIEKKIFNNQVEVEDLPALWNQLYQDYLGVKPENDREGILQDIHWSGGLFGYFPSYALGSVIAVQIYNHLKQIMPVEEMMLKGDFSKIDNYLQKNIYQYGKMKTTQSILKDMLGEDFDVSHYINYLKEKFYDVYEREEI